MEVVREPAVSGMFYPGTKEKLERDINLLLEITKSKENIDNIFGIVAPHAGYIYSGKTAAAAYNSVAGKNYNTVIIISPSHREYFPGLSIYSGDAYKTPLGDVVVNKEMREKLVDEGSIIFSSLDGHGQEHALEVQIPFLQVVLKDFSIVPIVMGDQAKKYVDELAEQLVKVIDDSTLIVASSDLSHFHSKDQADSFDSVVEKHITSFNYDGLLNDLQSGNCEACGGGGIATLLKAAKLQNRTQSKVLSRTDSGDVTGDDSEVVGYLSAIIY
jgi:AmmeMemoRadiSam system protein B